MIDFVTVFVPVFNEERNLPECLEALKNFRKVVILDSCSSDDTPGIAARYGREVVRFEWDGKFPKKRNWALRNYKIDTPWCLFLDADERMTPAFERELAGTLPTTGHDVFVVYYDNWFMGRMLRHGDVMRKSALVRHGHGEYERVEDAAGDRPMDMEIHEQILSGGTVGTIKAHLEHHDRRPLSNYYVKHCRYADWEARRYRAIEDWSVLTRREKIKYRLLRWKLFPLAYFFVSYVLKGGFLDGAPGFYFAINKMSYFYQIQAKLF